MEEWRIAGKLVWVYSPSVIYKVSNKYVSPTFEMLFWSASHNSWWTGTLLIRIITTQWEGMGDVGLVRYYFQVNVFSSYWLEQCGSRQTDWHVQSYVPFP